MKRILVQIVFAVFFAFSLSAQSDKCYTDHLVNQRYQNDPVYAQQFDAWRNQIVQLAQQNQVGQQRGALYTIPIVFHVILNSQALVNSVTDANIQAQVATLNKDFRKRNSDTSTIRSTFRPLASDIEIEFCLAARDPQGNSTNGITRRVTSHGAWDPNTEGDDMKFTASGGTNAWQPTKYVNVWIIDIAGSPNGGTAGYAYVGGNGSDGSSVDGIVLDFQLGFGSTERSLTHEMGHYMGLFHTWGNTNSCSNDDGIADTPESFTANFGCDYSENSCTSGSPDLPDQIENYMDYSSCPAMFTAGQKTVMRSVLTGSRVSLITNNNGCVPVNSPPVTDFYASVTSACTGSSITFTDNSTGGATSWSWSFPGGTPSSSTQQNPTVTYSTAGTYNVVLTATNSFGSDTETKTSYITVGTGISTTIFSENFEGTTTTWASVNPDGGETWEIVTGVGGSLPGNQAARVHCFDYSATGQRDGLVSPVISLAGKTNISLTFNYAHRRYSANEADSLVVYVSTNGGANFTRVYANAEDAQAGASFATGTLFQGDFVPTTDADWCAASATGVTCPVIDLNAYSGQANFRIKFEVVNDYGNNIYIDNIALTGICSGAVQPGPVAAFTTSDTSPCAGTSISFTDQSTNTPTSWSWQFTGGTPSTSTQRNPTVTYNAAGTYSVTLTATNANGSDGETKTNYITVVAAATGTTTFVSTGCGGVSTGSINLSVTGNGPYTYIWSNGATSQDISGLAAGNYTVTITDNNGCTSTKATTVTVAGGPSTTITKVDASCTGVVNGSVNLTVSGGNQPYSYNWSNGTTSQDLTAVASGTYTVTVIDGNNCTTSNNATVGAGAGPSAVITSKSDAACPGATNGQIDISVSGGSTPYSYDWSNGGTTQDLLNTASGTYTVTVTDDNGCTATQTSTVGEGPSLQLNGFVNNDSMNQGTGNVLVNVSNGTAPYGYSWSTGSSSVVITGLNAGSYSLTVTDANGCAASGSYTVGNDTATAIFVPSMDLTYSIFPNPTEHVLNVQLSLATPGTVRIALYNAIGQKVLEQSYANTADVNSTLDVTKLEEGMYFLRLENNSKTAVSRVVVMRN